MVTIVSSTSTWHWVNLIEHLGMKNIVSLYDDIINMFWEHKNGNDDKYINVLVSLCSTVSVVYFFSGLFWDSDVWVSTHFDHWSNLKKVDWLCNWPHISLQPGWSSSLFGWIAFKELLRISCLFKLRHSCNQPDSTCLPPLLWWTGNMNPEWKETQGIFYVVAATDSMAPSPLPDITALGGKFPSTSL